MSYEGFLWCRSIVAEEIELRFPAANRPVGLREPSVAHQVSDQLTSRAVPY